jgi:hypothetical protein
MRRSTTRLARSRRSLAPAALALVAGLAVLSPAPSSATDGGRPTGPAPQAADRAHARAGHALDRAREVLSGVPVAELPAAAEAPDATLALRDLFAALPELSGAQRAAADRILARPTNGRDPDAYRVRSRKTCGTHVCVHWVPTTSDAPPGRGWVDLTMSTMNAVWKREIGALGYRKPASDGTRGGNARLDVYLSDVGADGLYGYCQPETTVPGSPRRASGYCVLDNDFARTQFQAPPKESLRVTAAHEFFHASQFNYDSLEDDWFMEATATWMEERVYDSINDNRQYLRAGQVARPGEPLDVFNQYGSNQYGNWTFFEYLSSRWGNGIVRSAWNKAGAFAGAPNQYSTRAVRSVLAPHGGFPAVYSTVSAANTRPAETYAEGASWPSAAVARSWTLSKADPSRSDSARIDHMAARNLRATPGASLDASAWRLRVSVNGPRATTSPTAYLTIDRTGDRSTLTRRVRLNAQGNGRRSVPFSRAAVAGVTLTLANASTRFNCDEGTYLSCEGKPLDNNRAYAVTVKAFRP